MSFWIIWVSKDRKHNMICNSWLTIWPKVWKNMCPVSFLGISSAWKNLISIFSICFSEKPNKIVIQRVGDSADNIIASAGEDLEMECIATGGNPSPTLRWYADDQEIRSGHTQVLMFDCLIWGNVLLPTEKSIYRISANSFRGNYSFLKVENVKIFI